MIKYGMTLLLSVLGLWAALTIAIVLLQGKLMYHPVTEISLPEAYGLPHFSEIRLVAEDGVALQAWHKEASTDMPTVLYFHGNAGNLANRAFLFASLAEHGFGILAVSYRGYGKSEGAPSETGLYRDALAAYDYAAQRLHLPREHLIYFGESLGTGVAVELALRHPPALLALEAAYASVAKRAGEMYPFIPFGDRLARDKYDSLSKIGRVDAPLLMLHGALDTLIPVRHAQALFNAAREPKELIIYPLVHHADFSAAQIIEPLIKAYDSSRRKS
jgi:fermentation-respiration switch protein FrsA (DUF1100 family)